jgi:GPH family glycoside/pentoside/hexuronide:cation symporter
LNNEEKKLKAETEKISSNGEKVKNIPLYIFMTMAFGDLMIEFFLAAFGTRIFDFYENEIHLSSLLIGLAFVLYAIWNMFNDPLIGFISDKPRASWKKYGKRFPWILFGGISWALSFMLLFSTPDLNPAVNWLTLFLWLLVSICIYDTLFSIFDTNYYGLIPEKYRTDRNRIKFSSFQVGLGILGSVLGVVLPPLVIQYGDKSSFFLMSVIISIIGVILVLIQIPGIREDKKVLKRQYESEKDKERKGFFEMMRLMLKQRNFIAYLIFYTLYQATILLLLGSIAYLNRYIIQGDEFNESLIMLGYIFTGLLSIPLWSKVAKKHGNKRVFVIGGLIISLLTLPFLFVSTLIGAIITASILGIGLIGFWLMQTPILADVIDEAIVEQETKFEGFYMGVRTFFGRISIIIQALTFALIHFFTGFDPQAASLTDLAIIGLRIQMALIPMILMLIGVLAFWKIYDLSDERKKGIQAKLRTLKL